MPFAIMKNPLTTTTQAALVALICLAGCATPARVAVQPLPYTADKGYEAPIRALVDRRETIMATGYAVIGMQNSKNVPQQRLLAIRAAKIDAYRGLAEQVYGLFIDSNTSMSDMTVMSDTFRTKVEGVIYGATLTSINPINNDTYEVVLTLDRNAINDLRMLYIDQYAAKRR